MALALTHPMIDRPRPPEGWVLLAEAAARIGVDSGQLARVCREKHEHTKMARKFHHGWIVRREIDARLAGPGFEQRDLDQIAVMKRQGIRPDCITLGEAKRTIALGMDDITPSGKGAVADLEDYIARVLASPLARENGITRLAFGTLYGYRRKYFKRGLAGLVRRPDARLSACPIGGNAWELFLQAMSRNDMRQSVAFRHVADHIAYNRLSEDAEWTWPSYRTVLKHYATVVPLGAKILAQEGPHKFRAKCLPKIQRDWSDTPAGTILCGDERAFDFMARVNHRGQWIRVRLKLTAWLDMRSRMIVGWHIGEHANSDTILSSFMMACEAMGTLPDSVLIDNGMDYVTVAGRSRRERKWSAFDPKQVSTAFERLSIEAHYAIAKSPWSKGQIESRFNTVKNQFDRWFPGFWGGRPEERPWDANRWTTERIDLLPTVAEVSDAFGDFLDALHEDKLDGSGMFNLSPRQVMAQYFRTDPRPCPRETLEYACCRMIGPVKVTRDGIRHDSTRYGKHDEAVWRLQGQKVWFLADPIHGERITICDQHGVPQVVAFADNNIGQTKVEVREAAAAKRKFERIAKSYHSQSRDFALMTPVQRIAQMRADRARAEQTPDSALPPPPETQTLQIARPDIAAGGQKVAAQQRRAAGGDALRALMGADRAAGALNEFKSLDIRSLPSTDLEDATVRPRLDIRHVSGVEDDDA